MEPGPKDRVAVLERDPVVPELAETRKGAPGQKAGEPVKGQPGTTVGACASWRNRMISIMLAGRDSASLTALKAGLAQKDVNLVRAESGGIGLSLMAESHFDLVIADENLGDMTGLEFIRAIVSKRPLINCAVISSLTPEDFHEAGEGLGILMQLPVNPGREHADKLLERLESISNTLRM